MILTIPSGPHRPLAKSARSGASPFLPLLALAKSMRWLIAEMLAASRRGFVGKSSSRSLHLNGRIKSVDECLEYIVAEMLKRPLYGEPIARREAGHCGIPVRIGFKNGQRLPSEAYILPSGREQLKNQMSHYVSEDEELNPKKRTGTGHQKAGDKSAAIASFTMKRGNPHLDCCGNNKETPKVFSSGSREKQFIVVTLRNAISDNGFHKGKRGKKS